MKILLTGASGFVGSAILQRLIEEKFDVRVFIRQSSNRLLLKSFDVELCIGDLRDIKSLENAVQGCDIIIHTAADYRLWTIDPKEMIETNVTGTKNIISVATNSNVEKIIYTSSVAALGSYNGETLVNEETPSTLEEKIGPYKKSKFLAETEVMRAHEKHGLPIITLNPSAPIGPRDIKPTPTGRLVIQAALGKIPAYVNSGLNIVHVDDVAEGHLLALKLGKVGERYILGGENLTFLEILTAITELAGKRPPFFRAPNELMMPVAFISELWARFVSGKEPFATVDGVRMSKKPMYYSSKKAEKELGYKARPASEAFLDAINWFKEFDYI